MRIKFLFSSLLFLAAIAMVSIGCEKEGPQGPAGPAGPEGPQGPAGSDANVTCVECHGGNQVIASLFFQYEASKHATGDTWERNNSSCAGCHTSQGFIERMETGDVAGTVENPLPVNCYTCHKIHQTYTAADWAFTAGDPVTFMHNADMVDMGRANQCINCHQSRAVSPELPDPAGDLTATINITNKRYGPHHGPQGNMLAGVGGWEFDGGTNYANSPHTMLIDNGCVTCHMAGLDGLEAGGHTFSVGEAGSISFNGCVACHDDTDELEVLITDTANELDALMAQLKTLLMDQGVMGADDYAIVPGDFTGAQVGALYNYKYVLEDRSKGAHNFRYAKAMVENAIAAIE